MKEEKGKEIQKTFEETFGTGCAKFIRCDVSAKAELKGCVCDTWSF